MAHTWLLSSRLFSQNLRFYKKSRNDTGKKQRLSQECPVLCLHLFFSQPVPFSLPFDGVVVPLAKLKKKKGTRLAAAFYALLVLVLVQRTTFSHWTCFLNLAYARRRPGATAQDGELAGQSYPQNTGRPQKQNQTEGTSVINLANCLSLGGLRRRFANLQHWVR